MKICDTIWRNVVEEFYKLENYPNEQVLCLTDVTLRVARANEIQFDRGEYRLVGANEKAIKFAFIGGY